MAGFWNRPVLFMEELQQRPPGHPDGGPMHIDGAYSTFRVQNPDVVTLIASPNLGWQRSSRSDVTPNWWARTWVEAIGRCSKNQQNKAEALAF